MVRNQSDVGVDNMTSNINGHRLVSHRDTTLFPTRIGLALVMAVSKGSVTGLKLQYEVEVNNWVLAPPVEIY